MVMGLQRLFLSTSHMPIPPLTLIKPNLGRLLAITSVFLLVIT